MMRRMPLILVGAAAGAALAFVATQTPLAVIGASAQTAVANVSYRLLNRFADMFERVRMDYVEKPEDGRLIEGAINGMLNGLDSQSSYLSAKQLRDSQIPARGETGSLGIEVTMDDGLV